MDVDFETMSLTEIIRLQTELSRVLTRRFEKAQALGFTDIVGSTAYFARFGDEAGRALQQLHHDTLTAAITPLGGRIVDTAGDGAFTCFPDVKTALLGLLACLEKVMEENAHKSREHQLVLRIGVHHGNVLTDGTIVSGDAVNLCARITATADPGELRLSAAALREVPAELRTRCWPVPLVMVKGYNDPLILFHFDWRDEQRLPGSVFVRETEETFQLPQQDIIRFGRLSGEDGLGASNDVILTLKNKDLEKRLSRFHFELRRKKTGYTLLPLSRQPTEVDGKRIEMGTESPITATSIVKLSKAITLEFKPKRNPNPGNASPTMEPSSM